MKIQYTNTVYSESGCKSLNSKCDDFIKKHNLKKVCPHLYFLCLHQDGGSFMHAGTPVQAGPPICPLIRQKSDHRS